MACGLLNCGHIPTNKFSYVGAGSQEVNKPIVIPIWVDAKFSAADRSEIVSAAREWNKALNGRVILWIEEVGFDMRIDVVKKVVDERAWVILKIDSASPLNKYHGERTLAWANKIGGSQIYVIRDRVYDSWMKQLLMHELGHLLGSKHNGDYLMNEYFHWNRTRCVDYDSLIMVAAKYRLDMRDLNYCVYTD